MQFNFHDESNVEYLSNYKSNWNFIGLHSVNNSAFVCGRLILSHMRGAFFLNHSYFDFPALYIRQSVCTAYILSTVGFYFLFLFLVVEIFSVIMWEQIV